MLNHNVPPKSISAINHLGKKIARAEGLKLSQGHDRAAQSYGFPNYRAARNALGAASTLFPITIRERWLDRGTGAHGVEGLHLLLPMPLTDLVTPLGLVGRLGGMKLLGADTLSGHRAVDSQNMARWYACRCARAIQFIVATGLKPSNKWRNIWPDDDQDKKIPRCDHAAIWRDPKTGGYIITDEPYGNVVDGAMESRQRWCEQYGYEQASSSWAGMHNPEDGTVLYLLSRSDAPMDMAEIAKRLARAKEPVLEKNWDQYREGSEATAI